MIDPVNLFVNWALHAVVGRMAAADAFVRQYRAEIHAAAAFLRVELGCPVRPLHRGVLVEPWQVADGHLHRDAELQFVSFSEDPDVARWFADATSAVSGYVAEQRPQTAGYLIEHTPRAESILFHHSWADELQLVEAGRRHPYIGATYSGQLAWALATQREVILAGDVPPLPVKPFHRSAADDVIHGRLTPSLAQLGWR